MKRKGRNDSQKSKDVSRSKDSQSKSNRDKRDKTPTRKKPNKESPIEATRLSPDEEEQVMDVFNRFSEGKRSWHLAWAKLVKRINFPETLYETDPDFVITDKNMLRYVNFEPFVVLLVNSNLSHFSQPGVLRAFLGSYKLGGKLISDDFKQLLDKEDLKGIKKGSLMKSSSNFMEKGKSLPRKHFDKGFEKKSKTDSINAKVPSGSEGSQTEKVPRSLSRGRKIKDDPRIVEIVEEKDESGVKKSKKRSNSRSRKNKELSHSDNDDDFSEKSVERKRSNKNKKSKSQSRNKSKKLQKKSYSNKIVDEKSEADRSKSSDRGSEETKQQRSNSVEPREKNSSRRSNSSSSKASRKSSSDKQSKNFKKISKRDFKEDHRDQSSGRGKSSRSNRSSREREKSAEKITDFFPKSTSKEASEKKQTENKVNTSQSSQNRKSSRKSVKKVQLVEFPTVQEDYLKFEPLDPLKNKIPLTKEEAALKKAQNAQNLQNARNSLQSSQNVPKNEETPRNERNLEMQTNIIIPMYRSSSQRQSLEIESKKPFESSDNKLKPSLVEFDHAISTKKFVQEQELHFSDNKQVEKEKTSKSKIINELEERESIQASHHSRDDHQNSSKTKIPSEGNYSSPPSSQLKKDSYQQEIKNSISKSAYSMQNNLETDKQLGSPSLKKVNLSPSQEEQVFFYKVIREIPIGPNDHLTHHIISQSYSASQAHENWEEIDNYLSDIEHLLAKGSIVVYEKNEEVENFRPFDIRTEKLKLMLTEWSKNRKENKKEADRPISASVRKIVDPNFLQNGNYAVVELTEEGQQIYGSDKGLLPLKSFEGGGYESAKADFTSAQKLYNGCLCYVPMRQDRILYPKKSG